MVAKGGIPVLVLASIFCAFTLLITIGPAWAARSQSLTPRQTMRDCTTNLGRDLYGLGVRLGVYFQWFSGWVANNFVVDEIAGALDANSIFLFALLISVVSSTKTDAMTLMDGLIMLMLCAGTIWSVLSLWGYRTCVYRQEGPHGIRRFGGFGTHLRLLLAAGSSWYGIWYWTVGIKGLPRGLSYFGDVPSSCGKSTVSVFGQSIGGEAQYFALAVSLCAAGYSALVTLAAPLAAVTRLKKMYHFLREKQYASTSRLRFMTAATDKQLKVIGWVCCVLNLVWIIFVALLVELTLNENHAIGVLGGHSGSQFGQITTPAQLLPMLIGAFSFIRILYLTFELSRSPDGDVNPSLGRAASKRYAKAKRNSTQGMHFFKMFSRALEDVEDIVDGHHEEEGCCTDKYSNPHHDLHQRLNWWQRILVTWLPWFSLLWFWPWHQDIGRPVSPGEDTVHLKPRTEPVSMKTPHRTRFSDWNETEEESQHLDTSYRRPSQAPSLEMPLETIPKGII